MLDMLLRGRAPRAARLPRPARRADRGRRARSGRRSPRARRRRRPRSATRRRWSASASTSATSPTTSPTTTSAPRCCCARWLRALRRRRSCSRRAWSSTARAATAAPSTGSCGPAPRAAEDLDAGPLRAAVPASAGATLERRGRARGRAAGPAQRLRRDQGRAGAPVRRVRAGDGRARSPRCATTTSTGRGCRATRRTRAWPASSAPRWPPGSAPRVFEDGAPAARLRARARRRRAPTCWRSRPASPGAFNVAAGTPRTVGEMAAALARAIDGPEPEVTGEWRGGRRAPRVRLAASAPRPCSGFRAAEDFEAGMREFATAKLRA